MEMLRTIRDGIFLLGLTVVMAAVFVGSAQGAFPGKPGPLVYPRVSFGESADTGGLVLHGPRQRQKPHQLTANSGDDTPSFSADGRFVAFAGNYEAGTPLPPGRHIYVVNIDGSGLRQLTSGPDFDENPSFSPDGKKVVFDRHTSAGKAHVFRINIDGSGLRQLTSGSSNDSEPVYMPSGKRIVFVSNRAPGINIFVAGANGKHVRQLTHNKRDCFSGNCNLSPAWSPDGRHVAFLAVGRFSSDLEVMRADGGGEKEFSNGSTEEEGFGTRVGPPSWGTRCPTLTSICGMFAILKFGQTGGK
jgi:Tol biopolymer transport system component